MNGTISTVSNESDVINHDGVADWNDADENKDGHDDGDDESDDYRFKY